MKPTLVSMVILAAICHAQQPSGPAWNIERSNEQSGVDIDRFIGRPENSPVHLSHGTLLTHTILANGDPYNPGPNGAVLEYRKDLAVATLLGKNKT